MASYSKGHKKVGGRVSGTPNKKKTAGEILDEVAEEMAKKGKSRPDPIRHLIYVMEGDWEALNLPGPTFLEMTGKEVIEKQYLPMALRQKSASDLAGYVYAKLKALEHSGSVEHTGETKTQVIISLPDNGRSSSNPD